MHDTSNDIIQAQYRRYTIFTYETYFDRPSLSNVVFCHLFKGYNKERYWLSVSAAKLF